MNQGKYVPQRTAEQCQYYDYEGSNGLVLSIEDWGGKRESTMGSHWLVDCHGCPRDRLDNAQILENILITAAERGNLSVLQSQRHQFRPQGATVLLLLRESHLSLHTWPEQQYAALDLFTCGERANPAAACQTVLDFLIPHHHNLQRIERPMIRPLSS